MRHSYFKTLAKVVVLGALVPLSSLSATAGDVRIGVTGGAFVQTNDGTPFATTIRNTEDNNYAGHTRRVDPDYTFGGGLSVDFFQNNGNDIRLKFLVHSGDDSSLVHKDGENPPDVIAPTLIPDFFDVATTGSDYAGSKFDYHTTVFSADFGRQFTSPGGAFSFRPAIGIGGADSSLEQKTMYFLDGDLVVSDPTSSGFFVKEKSDFTGFGPQLSMDVRYCLTNRVSLVGSAVWNGLFANVHSTHDVVLANVNIEDQSISGDAIYHVSTDSDTSKSIVQAISADLGLAFNFGMDWLGKDSSGKVVLGYRTTEFLGGSESISAPGTSAGNDGATIHVFEDSGFHGPFLTLFLNV